jgi:hypothetical protein
MDSCKNNISDTYTLRCISNVNVPYQFRNRVNYIAWMLKFTNQYTGVDYTKGIPLHHAHPPLYNIESAQDFHLLKKLRNKSLCVLYTSSVIRNSYLSARYHNGYII